MIIQRRVKGGRAALPASVLKSIWREVDRQARRFNVSRSFVIATALAHTFGIKEQDDYHTAGEEKIKLVHKRKVG